MKVKRDDNGILLVRCPGCGESHIIDSRWTFNCNFEKPTFTPSLLIRTGHFIANHAPGDRCWCTYKAEHPGEQAFSCAVCHSFITDGRIQFLSDCTHALAGQTVDLPEWDSA